MNDTQSSSISLQYRAFVSRLYYTALVLCLLSIALIYRWHWQELESLHWSASVWRLLLLTSVPCGILWRLFFRVRPRLFAKLSLEGNHLYIDFGKNRSDIHFSQIREIRPSWLPPKYFGGFSLILNSGQKFFIGSLLKDSHRILQAIEKYDQQILAPLAWQILVTRTKACDHYWSRVIRKLENKAYWLYRLFFLPASSLGLYFYFRQSEWLQWQLRHLPSSPAWYLENYLVVFVLQSFVGIILSHWLDEILLRRKTMLVLDDENYSNWQRSWLWIGEGVAMVLAIISGLLYWFWSEARWL